MEQRTKRGDYYLGLDMGTDSVGWAVTDMDYLSLIHISEPTRRS